MITLNEIVTGVAAALAALPSDEGTDGSTHARLYQEPSAQRAGDWNKATARPLAFALYDEEPKQPAKDAVYITAEPVSSETIGGGRMRDNLVLIDLAYVKDGTLKRSDYYGYIAECDKLLRPTIEFAGRKIMPEDIAARNVDGVAHYTFMLAFFDLLDTAGESGEVMEILKIRKEM